MKKVMLVLLALGTLAGFAGTATASNGVMVIPFEKHWVGEGHYVGTACGSGAIDMQLSDSYVTGNVQHFRAAVQVSCPDGLALTAALEGSFNFSTGRTVLNGSVVDGSLVGAQVHEEGQLVSTDPYTFVGTIQLMPGSAD
jgi:hypothetical protein